MFPLICSPVYSRHHAQMGRQARHEAYSKVRHLTRSSNVLTRSEHRIFREKVEDIVPAACAIDVPPVGEFPRVGEDGYQ